MFPGFKIFAWLCVYSLTKPFPGIALSWLYHTLPGLFLTDIICILIHHSLRLHSLPGPYHVLPGKYPAWTIPCTHLNILLPVRSLLTMDLSLTHSLSTWPITCSAWKISCQDYTMHSLKYSPTCLTFIYDWPVTHSLLTLYLAHTIFCLDYTMHSLHSPTCLGFTYHGPV